MNLSCIIGEGVCPESRPPDPLSQAAENRSECIFPFPK